MVEIKRVSSYTTGRRYPVSSRNVLQTFGSRSRTRIARLLTQMSSATGRRAIMLLAATKATGCVCFSSATKKSHSSGKNVPLMFAEYRSSRSTSVCPVIMLQRTRSARGRIHGIHVHSSTILFSIHSSISRCLSFFFRWGAFFFWSSPTFFFFFRIQLRSHSSFVQRSSYCSVLHAVVAVAAVVAVVAVVAVAAELAAVAAELAVAVPAKTAIAASSPPPRAAPRSTRKRVASDCSSRSCCSRSSSRRPATWQGWPAARQGWPGLRPRWWAAERAPPTPCFATRARRPRPSAPGQFRRRARGRAAGTRRPRCTRRRRRPPRRR